MRLEADERPARSTFAYPVDRFDQVTHGSRVGAHRIAARGGRKSLFVVVGAIVTVLLVILGAMWVNNVGGASTNEAVGGADASIPAAEVDAVLDPSATIAILNGTPIDSLQNEVEAAITSGGWGQVAFGEYAVDREVSISAVFYRDTADESAARALAAQLGGVSTYITEDYEDFGVRFVVLLGADYAGPGLVEAQQATTEVSDVSDDSGTVGSE